MFDPERDVQQHLAGRNPPRPATGPLDVESHLLVARTPKPLLFGMFSDLATDVGNAVRPSREAVDLIEETHRDPRREEPHELTMHDKKSRVRHGFVPKPCPSNRLLLGI
jgi:hypothetical protein